MLSTHFTISRGPRGFLAIWSQNRHEESQANREVLQQVSSLNPAVSQLVS